MNKQQITEYITSKLVQYPDLAENYKSQKINHLWLNVEVVRRYGSSSDMIDACRNDLAEAKVKTAEELFVEDYINDYQECIHKAKLIAALGEEDNYCKAIFCNTSYNIQCKEDYLLKKPIYQEIAKIYQDNLDRRDYFVQIGKQMHGAMLAELQRTIESMETNFEATAQDMLFREHTYIRNNAAHLARLNASDSFESLGFENIQYRAPQLMEKLLQSHDPVLVDEVMQNLIQNPSQKLVELAQNYDAKSELDTKVEKVCEVLGAIVSGLGAATTAVEIAKLIIDQSPSLAILLIGAAEIVYGVHYLHTYSNKEKYIKSQQQIILECFNEIESQVASHEKMINQK